MGCSPKRFSRPPRCDRFDTPPCPSIISVFYAPVNRLIRARLRFVLRRAFTLFSALFCRRRYAATFLPALYRLPRLSPIPRLLFYCRRYAATLLLALCRLPRLSPIPRLLFIVADMPQCFCSRFAACLAFTLFSALFCRRRYAATFLPALCRLPRFSLFPACFLLPLYAKVRSFALRFVPPLLVAFFRARALARFAVRALTANRSALKKPPR